MVLRISLTKWSSYPDIQLSSQLLGLNENVFFFLFSFFFSFYLLFLLKPSPIFFHFFLSFSNWFLCSSQAFDCNTLRISNSSSCYSCNMDIPASSFLFHFKLFYDKLTILSEKQKIAHNQLNAEGLVSQTRKWVIGEGRGRKTPSPSPPLSGGWGMKKKNNSSQDQQDLFPHFFNTMMVPLG